MRISGATPVRPFALTDINVGNSVRFEVTSLDFDNAKEAPASMRYRIDNLTNMAQVLDWTSVMTPLTVTTLAIPASLNNMSYQGVDQQFNQVTIEATYADGTKATWVGAYRLNQIYNSLAMGAIPT